jgi:DNA topoisomerase-1
MSASSAGLRHVSDERPGIRRVMGPMGFRYLAPSGRMIRTPSELKRIAALAVPPAWTDVWICTHPRGHLQATGRDAKGRKQYRYHRAWRACRDETKFDRLTTFAAALPGLRSRTNAHLTRSGLPREKVLATVVRLLERSLIRVGNDEYARQNHSFGLTTLRDSHVRVRGARLRFEFRGKSGVRHAVDVTDRRLARVVRQCRDLPGQELFQYLDETGCRRNVTSSHVNAYLKEVTGEAFTAKDFRTWAGTVLAVAALRECGKAPSQRTAKKHVLQAIEAVAGVLGNTRAVCRSSYVHPAVLEAYVNGTLVIDGSSRASRLTSNGSALRPDEGATLALLRRLARSAHRRAA